MTNSETASHSRLMDAVYRNQRHIYDVTRKYYLLGRDHLIDRLDVPEGGSVLEVACGTGRNLVRVARRYPQARLYGFDISAQMLETAQRTMARKALLGRTVLAEGDATDFDAEALFGVAAFDRVFISYSVSMIPGWQQAIARAACAVAPRGELHVVDFGQQTRLPGPFRTGLHRWLARFHVTPRADLETVMAETARAHGAELAFEPLYRDYARYGRIRLPAP